MLSGDFFYITNLERENGKIRSRIGIKCIPYTKYFEDHFRGAAGLYLVYMHDADGEEEGK